MKRQLRGWNHIQGSTLGGNRAFKEAVKQKRLENMKKPKRTRFSAKNWDWFKYLKATPETKEKYHEQAVEKAAEWTTCAVGQLCDAIPRKYGNGSRPVDETLYNLGERFMWQISDRFYDKAEKTLHEIEARTVELLNQMNK